MVEVRKRGSVEGSKVVVIVAKWWQKGKKEVADKEKTHIRVPIINHRQQCLFRSHYLSIESVAATRPRVARQSSRIGKAGEAWNEIGLEGELTFFVQEATIHTKMEVAG